MLDRMHVIDNQSTSGTYVNAARIQPQTPVPIDPNGIVAFGPIPVAVPLLSQIAQIFAGQGGAAPVPSGPMPAPANPSMPSMANPAMQNPAPQGDPNAGRKKHQTVLGKLDWASGNPDFKTIGRTPDNDIRVDHPQISSRHAVLTKRGAQLFLEDRRSANGTFVRGQRIPPGVPVQVQNGERVYIGPIPLVIEFGDDGGAQFVMPGAGWEGRPQYEIEALRLTLQVPDRDDPNTMKTLLDDISFKALPGDMIALMGPSGAGKTTLLMTLNGYMQPTGGEVRINGEDLYAIYDNLRGSIGYVPQDDIVHPELTVFEAVKYSARFRLPPDYSEEEIDALVMRTLQQLSLDSLANLEIGKPEKKVLSGGQRKRVNIALELVTDPVILFLDEPTSGLAADDTTALITLLSDLAKTTGKTIIMTIHQPAKDEYEKFNLALIMGFGGVPMYYGPTKKDSYRFFGTYLASQGKPVNIDNPRDMFDVLKQREDPVYNQLRARDPNTPRNVARYQCAKMWQGEFIQSPTYQLMYSGQRALGQQGSRHPIPDSAPSTAGQLGLLLSRYLRVKTRDVSGTVIMLAQAPIIGLLLAFVFGKQKDAVPFWCIGALQELSKRNPQGGDIQFGDLLKTMGATGDRSAAMFFLVVSAIWFGTSNAAREIVSERAIYLRERMVNLGLFNYVMSKFVLLCFFCVVQCSVLLGIVFFALGFQGGMKAFGVELLTLLSVSCCAVSLGLILSTIVTSSEAAMALTPIALIPQIILGGMIVPMTTNSMLKPLMALMPSRWGFQGVVAQERVAIANDPAWVVDLKRPELTSPDDFLTAGKFMCAKAQLASENFSGAWGFSTYDQTWVPFAVLSTMTFFSLISVLILLKRRDPV
jgi:ABC-type multidrug transport system ATPase subunit